MPSNRKNKPVAGREARQFRIPFNWRRSLVLALHALREAGLIGRSIVVLVGSFAQGAATWRSDVDLLVLLKDGRPASIKVPFGVHLRFEDLDQFSHRLARGDDYVVAAVRFGKVLHDGLDSWKVVREQMKSASWPNWKDKIRPAERRIRLGKMLMGTGDLDAAAEEYLLGATQISRAILLRHGIYPFSRVKLPKQLISIGRADLAGDIRILIEGKCEQAELRRIGGNLQRILTREAGEPNQGKLNSSR